MRHPNLDGGRAVRLLLACCFLVLPAQAQVETIVFSESFDGVAAPTLPAGWTATGAGWATSATSPSTGSGGQNLVHAGTAAGAVTTPVLDLSGLTSGTLRYLVRRSGTYARDNLTVTASTDGGGTFPVVVLAAGAALPEQDGIYRAIEVPLPAELLGEAQVALRFEALGGGSAMSVARLDDVTLEGLQPFVVAPGHLAFSTSLGTAQSLSFSVTNQSGQPQLLDAPAVSDAAFTVVPDAAVTLADGEAQPYTVTFTPGGEGSVTGSIAIGHAGGSLAVTLAASTSAGSFGFAAASTTALEESGFIEIPLSLDYGGGVPLQGLEFSVTWDAPLLGFVDVVRTAAVAGTAAWTLAYEAEGQSVHVVLLGNGTTGLPAGSYAPVLVLRLASGAISPLETQTVHLAVEGIIGAQAVAEGTDAGLRPGTGAHTVTLTRRRAFFAPSADTLDVGPATSTHPAEATFTVSNPGGTRALTISAVTGTNPSFTISPATATVAPEGSQLFTVTFTPPPATFGLHAGRFTFTHDGEGGPTFDLEVTGRAAGGQGDADGDGLVDVMDLILGIDFVLGRLDPTAGQHGAVDLFPFPGGDDALDVRDLTVLAQAIASGEWPDGQLLPDETGGAAKTTGLAGVSFGVGGTAEEAQVWLDHTVPLRAVQLILEAPALRALPVVLPDSSRPDAAVLRVRGDRDGGRVRLLLYRPDGGVLPPGRYALAALPIAGRDGLAVRYATAVDGQRRRVPVAVDLAAGPGMPVERPTRFALGRPYPNPFRAGAGQSLLIPVLLPDDAPVEAAVYDVQGRCVARLARPSGASGEAVLSWDGLDASGRRVGPGMYLIRAGQGASRHVQTVVVLQ